MMNQKFVDFMSGFAGKKLAVAVSGGVDSVCLLNWCKLAGMNIVALHVNHGLRAAADIETQYVQDLCEKLNVPCRVFYWTGEKPDSGLENAARDARYKMMTDFCQENDIYALLVAHQADDQIETFLMNLGRGSGLFGLAAMRRMSMRDGVRIVRPLLDVSRAELRAWCDEHNVKYFIDEMNSDPHYTRVKIRQNRHLISEKLGISDARILLAVQNLGRLRDKIENDVDKMVADVVDNRRAVFGDVFLFDLDPDFRLRFIGKLIQTIGGDKYPPRLNSLAGALSRLRGNCKFTLGHCTLRRLGARILVVPEGEKTTFRKKRHEKKHI